MDYNFNSIAGYETEKEELKRLCNVFNNRKKHQTKGAKLPKGIIFYGESGTGKTLFSKVLASECGLDVLKINIADTEKDSDICKIIRKTFNKAKKKSSPTMIFFDELDKVLPNDAEEYYTDRSKTILAQLLTLIDGMDTSGDIVFVATCNYYNSIPESLVRPGRIDKKISIGLPDYNSRVEILKMYTRKTSCKFEMSIEEMARLCSGFSCAALETFINECILQSNDEGFINEELIKARSFEIKNEDIPRERSSVEDYINACQNVGMLIVSKVFNSGHYTLTLEKGDIANDFFDALITLNESSDDSDDDWDDDDDEDDNEDYDDEENQLSAGESVSIFSKNDYLNAISVLYGGYAAEEVVLQKTYDNVMGTLDYVDTIMGWMLQSAMFGLDLRYNNDRSEDGLPYTNEKIAKINEVIDKTCEDCYERAKIIVEKNAKIIEKLAKVLVEKQVLQESECDEIIKKLGGINY